MSTPQDKQRPLGPSTRLLHAGTPPLQGGSGPVNVPVVRTSTVRFADSAAYADLHHRREAGERVASYGRHGLDTHRALEDAVVALEGGHRAFLTPSGLSAITLVLIALLSPGDHALVADSVYSPVRRVDATLLQRLGITLEYFSPSRDDLADKIRPNTRLVYLESPSSLLYEVLDLPALAAVARQHGIAVATDNTWSGGWFYQPLEHGANLSIQAATKYIAGHSDVMQGIVITDGPALSKKISTAYEALGLTIGADDAYLALRGLRTLPVRLAQHQRHATEIAQWLEQQPQVGRVFYPALPSDPGHALWKRDFSGASGLVSFAFAELAARTGRDVRSVVGGTSAWAAAGLPLGQGDADVLTGDDDQWYSPYAHRDLGLRDAGFRAYLDWELGLVEQLERDGWASGIRLVPV